MKLHWGSALIAVFIVFGSMIGYLVYRCSGTSSDLVSAEYYKDELAYQKVIDGSVLGRQAANRPVISCNGDSVSVQFPASDRKQAVWGEAYFYCAAHATRDRKDTIRLTGEGTQRYVSRLNRGHYTLKLTWRQGTDYCYYEQPLIIQ